jgi:hypothetical protein
MGWENLSLGIRTFLQMRSNRNLRSSKRKRKARGGGAESQKIPDVLERLKQVG